MKAAMLIGRGQIIHNTEQAPESRGKLQGPQLLPSLSTGYASGSHYTTLALRKSNRPGSQSPHPGQSRPKFSRKAQRPTAQTLCLEPLPAPRPKRPNGCCSLAGPAFEPAWATFTHCPAFYPIAPTVEHAAGLAMRAVTPTGRHNPSGTAGPTPSAAKTGGVARKTACSTSRGRPQGGASRQACRAGSHAGRATQSRAVRRVPRHPPPRLAAWHARLRAPLEGVARKTARTTSRRRASLWLQAPRPPAS